MKFIIQGRSRTLTGGCAVTGSRGNVVLWQRTAEGPHGCWGARKNVLQINTWMEIRKRGPSSRGAAKGIPDGESSTLLRGREHGPWWRTEGRPAWPQATGYGPKAAPRFWVRSPSDGPWSLTRDALYLRHAPLPPLLWAGLFASIPQEYRTPCSEPQWAPPLVPSLVLFLPRLGASFPICSWDEWKGNLRLPALLL